MSTLNFDESYLRIPDRAKLIKLAEGEYIFDHPVECTVRSQPAEEKVVEFAYESFSLKRSVFTRFNAALIPSSQSGSRLRSVILHQSTFPRSFDLGRFA